MTENWSSSLIFRASSGYFTRVSIIELGRGTFTIKCKSRGTKIISMNICMTWPGQNFMHRVHTYVEILQSFFCHYWRNQNEFNLANLPSKLARAFLTLFTLGIATVNFTTKIKTKQKCKTINSGFIFKLKKNHTINLRCYEESSNDKRLIYLRLSYIKNNVKIHQTIDFSWCFLEVYWRLFSCWILPFRITYYQLSIYFHFFLVLTLITTMGRLKKPRKISNFCLLLKLRPYLKNCIFWEGHTNLKIASLLALN